MPADFREQVLEHVKCSHAAMDVANAELTKVAEQQKQVAELIPQAVEVMVQHDRIEPSQREKLAEMLKDPATVIKILMKTADAKNTVKPPALGAPTQEKVAGVVPQGRARYTGERTSEKTAADLAFENALFGNK